MRLALILISLCLTQPAWAAPLIEALKPDPAGVEFLAQDRGALYKEWQVVGADDIRYVAQGYDVIDDEFYRVGKDGKHEHILTFYAAMRAPNGKFYNHNQFKVRSLSLPSRMGPRGLEVWASFEHDITINMSVCYPLWQRRIPIVLFEREPAHRGERGQRAKHKFRLMPLEELIEQARRTGPRARLSCDGRCCYPEEPEIVMPPAVEAPRRKIKSWHRGNPLSPE
jgi:hypothetical protein